MFIIIHNSVSCMKVMNYVMRGRYYTRNVKCIALTPAGSTYMLQMLNFHSNQVSNLKKILAP